MPARVKVKVIAGKNLPIMDRSSFLTDAFVEVRLGNTTYKTEVFRKSLNPAWNSEWYRFEIDDEELQEEALQIRVLDHDTYSAHDTIGRVYLDLNPLLERDGSSSMSGWFPIYDTMHGIRGEIHISVRVELFSDANRFRQSSLGVKFFYSGCVPHGWICSRLLGFVEELVVNDDPEYHWIDKIRTSRASNEARQRLFSQLNGQLQRKLGRKVLKMEGNAVLGYLLHFDLEGESGIVVRGIGTAALLSRPQLEVSLTGTPPVPMSPGRDSNVVTKPIAISNSKRHNSSLRTSASCSPPSGSAETALLGSTAPYGVYGTEKDEASDKVDATELPAIDDKGFVGSVPPSISKPVAVLNSCMSSTLEYQGFPFLTLSQYPPGFLIHMAGVVSAKSVKLLDVVNNPDEPLTRDTWWIELRNEIRCHMRALACDAVISYREETFIFEDIVVLSAYGTAAVVDLDFGTRASLLTLNPSLESSVQHATARERGVCQVGSECRSPLTIDVQLANQHQNTPATGFNGALGHGCAILHAPYKDCEVPFPVVLSRCGNCRRSCVPDLLFATVDLPLELASSIALASDSALIQARVFRKRDAKSEFTAKEISDCLPFVEFELHRQLLDKLRLKGMNALFGLRTRLAIGEEAIVALSTATGYCLQWLPPAPFPRLCTRTAQLENRIHDHVTRNKKAYHVEHLQSLSAADKDVAMTSIEDSEPASTKSVELDLSTKDTFVIEVSDESEAEDLVSLLLEDPPTSGFFLNTLNCGRTPSQQQQLASHPLHQDIMFTRIWCGPLTGPLAGEGFVNSLSNSTCSNSGIPTSTATSSSSGAKELSSVTASHQFAALLHDLVRSTCFLFRMRNPCHLAALDFRISLPDENQLQIHLTGVCQVSAADSELVASGAAHTTALDSSDSAQDFPPNKHVRATSVLLTPLYVPPAGRLVEAYLGNLDFFFVRETSAVRECGGHAGFLQSVVSEVQAVVRAHAACLNGNAVLAYHLSEAVLMNNINRNQAQCLLNVCGDIVRLAS